MRDWIAKLDDFLRISERDILTHAGKVRHETALTHAEGEYEKWQKQKLAEPTRAEKDFDAAVEKIKKLDTAKRKKKS
jgi:hypothetical protein